MTTTSTDFRRVCGLDEVGRGALAGPLVAAAVILPPGFLDGLGDARPLIRDSKTLSRPQRQRAGALIRATAECRIVALPVGEIDGRGIGWANSEAFRRLIEEVEADEYIVDGNLRLELSTSKRDRVRTLVRADASEPAVAAASIIAKTFRDDLMVALGESCPGYGWERNAGYGTPEHLSALRKQGPTVHHRALFTATALR